MKYFGKILVIMAVFLLLISCATINAEQSATQTGENAGTEITSLGELAEQYGIEIVEEPSSDENEMTETEAQPVQAESYPDAEVDINDAELWTELEIPSAEEGNTLQEEAALPPETAEEVPAETQPQAPVYADEKTLSFPSMDMSALAPMHMDATEPSLSGAEWTSAENLVIPPLPEKTEETDVASEEKVFPVTEAGEPEWNDIPTSATEKVPVSTFVEAVSVAPEWDMLSEYDRFLAELGDDVKIADSVSNTSFIEPETVQPEPVLPEPIQNEPMEQPSLQIDEAPADVQWTEVVAETPQETEVQKEPLIVLEHVEEDAVPATAPEKPEGKTGFFGFLSRIWQAITGFFVKIFSWIKGLFTSIPF